MRRLLLALPLVVGCASQRPPAPEAAPPPSTDDGGPRWAKAPASVDSSAPREEVAPPRKPEVAAATAAANIGSALEDAQKRAPQVKPSEPGGLFAELGSEEALGFGGLGGTAGIGGLGLAGTGTGGGGVVGGTIGLGSVGGLGRGSGTGTTGARVLVVDGQSDEITPSRARATIATRLSRLNRCVADAKAAKATIPASTVTVRLDVDANGLVTKATSGLAKPLGPCVDGALKGAKFPADKPWHGRAILRLE